MTQTRIAVGTAALYCRLSAMSHAEDGLSAAIPRQEQASRRVVVNKWGETVATRVYTDDDVSAWSGKRRPGWEQMLSDITAGEVHAVVAYDLDRLYRQPRDLERLFDICDKAGVTEMATAQAVTGPCHADEPSRAVPAPCRPAEPRPAAPCRQPRPNRPAPIQADTPDRSHRYR